MSSLGGNLVLLDSELIKQAQTLSEVPAQSDREDVDEGEQRERVEQHHCVLQERKSCEDNKRRRFTDSRHSVPTIQIYKVKVN